MKNKYYSIRSKSLAYAMNYIGYNFLKFNDEFGNVFYSFENNKIFQKDLRVIKELRFKNK